MERTNKYDEEFKLLRKSEADLLVKFVAEKHVHNFSRKRKLSPVQLISCALMGVRAEYTMLIKKYYGGWSCGTYANKQREHLTRIIAEKYTEHQIHDFIEYCVATHDAGRTFATCDDADIIAMVEELLSIRPRPLVNLKASLLNTKDK